MIAITTHIMAASIGACVAIAALALMQGGGRR